MNDASIQQTDDEPSEFSEFIPIKLEVESIVDTSVDAYPSGAVYGFKVENTNEPPKPVQALPPLLVSGLASNELPQVSSSPPAYNAPSVGENILNSIETPLKPQCFTYKQTLSSKERRQIAKDEERIKLIKLTQEHTEAITRQTAALEKLTTAIEMQNRLLQEKLK